VRQRQSAEKQKPRCFRETLAGWKSAAKHFVARGPKLFPRARHETIGGNSRGVLEKTRSELETHWFARTRRRASVVCFNHFYIKRDVYEL